VIGVQIRKETASLLYAVSFFEQIMLFHLVLGSCRTSITDVKFVM
jgi:hypothetical protein